MPAAAAALSDADARHYLASKGVSAFVDSAIMKMLEDLPEDPVEWLQSYAAKSRKAAGGGGLKAAKAPPAGVAVAPRKAAGAMWSQIADKLPCGRSDEEKLARGELFNKIDVQGNHSVSEADAIQGLKGTLHFEGKTGIDYVMHRAYLLIRKVCKDGGEVRPANVPADNLTRPQFRLLLLYLRRYCQLLAIFDEFDSDEDLMVDFEEFKQVVPKLDNWGIRIYYPETAFKMLDKDHKGEIPFLDFADFVIGKELDIEPMTAEDEFKAGETAWTNTQLKAGRPLKGSVVSSFRRGRTGPIDWALIAEKLPYGRSEAETQRRKELWGLIDMNGNGILSLAEVDKAMRDVLGLEDLYDCKPAMLRAFNAAKEVGKEKKSKLAKDFVTRSEFRILLEYLRKYFELFVMFDWMDEDNDRRLSEKEFVAAGKKLAAWGVKATDLPAEFKKMDANHGGFVLFEEFCHWAIPQNLAVDDDREH